MAVRFKILEGANKGEHYEYDANCSFVVGRDTSRSTHLAVPQDQYMSRFHFVVEVGVGECLIRDCGSKNGLFVNDDRVSECALKDGDVVKAGRTKMVIRFDSIRTTSPLEAGMDAVDDRFHLIKQLKGAGGARVFQARDTSTNTIVALKFLRFDHDHGSELESLFRRELDAVSMLRHECIVPVLATGMRDDEAWLAAEWIEGMNLEERIESSSLYTELQAVDLGIQILGALSYAHNKGYVHRDVKPANILLQDRPWGAKPLLTDFGLAKRVGHEDSSLTSTGTTRGTPRFMPPEQIMNSNSARSESDQFAMAATIYYAATGKWHYEQVDHSIWEVLLSGPVVPIRMRRRSLSRELESILLRAMEPDPADRHSSTAEFRRALIHHRESLAREPKTDT